MSYTTEALLIGQWTPEELEEEHEYQRQQEADDAYEQWVSDHIDDLEMPF